MTEQLKGHGHVTPNADGFLARCGGPSICKVCKAEIAALKAQEPVEYQLRALIRDVTNIPEAGYYMPQSWHDQVIALSLSGKLDAPVSEAKAQGVVQWPEADEIMQMAFEEGHPADDASGYYFELEEFDLFIERLMSEVARLNAAPVQQVSVPDELARAFITGESCDGVYRVVIQFETLKEMQAVHSWLAHLNAAPAQQPGPSGSADRYFYDAGFEAGAKSVAAPVQQVSVPDGFRVMNPTSAVVRDGDRWEIYAPCGSGGIVHEDDVRDWVVRKLLDAIAAAPAAPAADASDVLDQAMYTLISIGYHENSGLVHELRQALAAHRSTGVV